MTKGATKGATKGPTKGPTKGAITASGSVEPGLCRRCVHARSVTSGRGSTFWRCSVHDRDPRWPKYPPLPVLRCPHFLSPPPRDG